MDDLDLGTSSGSLISLFLGSSKVGSLKFTDILYKDSSVLWEFQNEWMDLMKQTQFLLNGSFLPTNS